MVLVSVGRALTVQHELQRLALERVQAHRQTLHACQQASVQAATPCLKSAEIWESPAVIQELQHTRAGTAMLHGMPQMACRSPSIQPSFRHSRAMTYQRLRRSGPLACLQHHHKLLQKQRHNVIDTVTRSSAACNAPGCCCGNCTS